MRMTAQEARRRLAAARVARLATVTSAGQPHLVPVTLAVDGDRIYTVVDDKPKTTRDLQRLRNLRASPRVAVLADHYDEDWTQLWWARADGTASVIADPVAMAAPIQLLAKRYRPYQDRLPGGPVIAVLVDRWTGWSAS
jgi:PPOX class probable F420-dependent enzyme